jgi:hypothetical protein
MTFQREPDAGNPHVRFDERRLETERPAPPRQSSTLPDNVRLKPDLRMELSG